MPKKKQHWTRICPNCGSRKIDHRGVVAGSGKNAAYSNNYVCLSCGYHSPLFPEMTDEAIKETNIDTNQPKRFIQSRFPIFPKVVNKWLAIFLLLLLLIITILRLR